MDLYAEWYVRRAELLYKHIHIKTLYMGHMINENEPRTPLTAQFRLSIGHMWVYDWMVQAILLAVLLQTLLRSCVAE